MDRKAFIKTCGAICLGIPVLNSMPGCGTIKNFTCEIEDFDMIVPLSHFKSNNNGQKNYIIVHNDILQYPICVYRLEQNKFSALWMKCTHQGSELQVFGQRLQCPAHGSEFNNIGDVQNGPADKTLRTFPVSVENERLKISLK